MIVGREGPAVLISAKTAAFLERYAGLASLRVRARGVLPEVAAELTDIREAALLYRPLPSIAEVEAGSAEVVRQSWLTPAEVADLVQVTDRAIRLACMTGRIDADQINGRWRIPKVEADRYINDRRARSA